MITNLRKDIRFKLYHLVAAVLLRVVTLHAETPVSLPRSGRAQSGMIMIIICDCACAPVRRVPHLEGPGPVHVLHADPVLAPLDVDRLGRPVVVGVGAADLQYMYEIIQVSGIQIFGCILLLGAGLATFSIQWALQ